MNRPGLNVTSADLLKRLLVSDPNRRANGRVMKNHTWFLGLDWEKLERGEVPPPFIPALRGSYDGQYFDPGAAAAVAEGAGGSPPPYTFLPQSPHALDENDDENDADGVFQDDGDRDSDSDDEFAGWDDEF